MIASVLPSPVRHGLRITQHVPEHLVEMLGRNEFHAQSACHLGDVLPVPVLDRARERKGDGPHLKPRFQEQVNELDRLSVIAGFKRLVSDGHEFPLRRLVHSGSPLGSSFGGRTLDAGPIDVQRGAHGFEMVSGVAA